MNGFAGTACWPTPLHWHPSANTIAAEASGMRGLGDRAGKLAAGRARAGRRSAAVSACASSNQRRIALRPTPTDGIRGRGDLLAT